MIRKSEITFKPDDIDGSFGHKPITEKRVGCFQKEKQYLFSALNFKIGRLYLNEFSLFLRKQGIKF
jgi:hypothetical protein